MCLSGRIPCVSQPCFIHSKKNPFLRAGCKSTNKKDLHIVFDIINLRKVDARIGMKFITGRRTLDLDWIIFEASGMFRGFFRRIAHVNKCMVKFVYARFVGALVLVGCDRAKKRKQRISWIEGSAYMHDECPLPLATMTNRLIEECTFCPYLVSPIVSVVTSLFLE